MFTFKIIDSSNFKKLFVANLIINGNNSYGSSSEWIWQKAAVSSSFNSPANQSLKVNGHDGVTTVY